MKNRLLHWLILVLIIGLGAFLRYYRLLEFTNWYGDAGRDLIVARHQAGGEFVWAYPDAYGAHGAVKNSSFYFIFLTIVWKILPGAIPIINLFTALGVVTIVLAYFLGRTLHNSTTGLITAFLFAISSFMIEMSRSIWQPYLLLPITVLALIATSQFHKKAKFSWLLIACQVIFLGLHIHFSFLPLALFLISWNFWLIFKHHLRKFYIALFIALFTLNTIVLITAVKSPIDLSKPPVSPISLIGQINPSQISDHLIKNFEIVTSNLIKINQPFSLLSVVLILVSLLYFSCKYKNLVAFYLVGANLSFIFAACYKYDVSWHYFMPYYPLAIISGCFIIRQIRIQLFQLFLVLAYAYLLSQQAFSYFTNSPVNEFAHHQAAADIIKNDLNEHPGETFSIQGCYDGNCDIWAASGVWFFMEKNTELLKIDADQKSLTLKEANPKLIYLVCPANISLCPQIAERNNFHISLVGKVNSAAENSIYIYKK